MLKHAKPLLIAALLSGAAGVVQAADKALIIGVGKYANPGSDLPGIDIDVDMARQIASRMGFETQHTRVLRDQEASVQALRQELKQLSEQVHPDDRVFIYFSGHGSNTEDKNNDESDGLDETLELHDGSFIDDELGEWLAKLKSQNVVVLIDACHSGTATKSLGPNRYGMVQGRVKARNLKQASRQTTAVRKDLIIEEVEGQTSQYVAIGAAQDNQYALATAEGSVFTKAMLDSLEEVRRSQTEVSLKALFDRTTSKVANVTDSFVPNLTGSPQLAQKVIRFADVQSSLDQKILWRETVSMVNASLTPLTITAPDTLKEGDVFEFEVDVPKSGYLNVVTIGPTDNATVLFPNPRVTDNRVDAKIIKIPTTGTYRIRAQAPFGKTLVAAFLTDQSTDLQKSAIGNRDVKGVLTGLGQMTVSGVRALGRESLQKQSPSRQTSQYAAGMHEVNIVKR